MPQVLLWGALQSATDGQASIELPARTIGELFQQLEERYPLMQPYIDEGIAVSIDGVVFQDSWAKELPDDVEIYLLPRIQGG